MTQNAEMEPTQYATARGQTAGTLSPEEQARLDQILRDRE